jgi:hypothetical protein
MSYMQNAVAMEPFLFQRTVGESVPRGRRERVNKFKLFRQRTIDARRIAGFLWN